MNVEWRDVEGQLKAFAVTDEGHETPLVWCPQPGSQVAFLACPLYEVLYEGERGPGKTDALIMDFCQHCGEDDRTAEMKAAGVPQMKGWGQEWRGVIFRQTYPQLADVIAKTKKWLPMLFPGVQFNEAAKTWRWPTGEELYLRHMSREDDYWNYHGHQYPFIGFEELTTWADDRCYRKMMSCSRSTTPGMPRKYRATTNPYGPGHGWVKRRFGLKRLPKGRIVHAVKEGDVDEATGQQMPDRVAIKGRLDENKILLHADPGYPARLAAAARNEAERRAWMEGDWDIVAGGMFDDLFYEYKEHIILEPFEIPKTWRIERSFDWGSSAPFSVGWWARSDGSDYKDANGVWRSSVRGDRFRIAEWYGTTGQPNEGLRLLAKDIARGIIEREEQWGIREQVKKGVADSSIFDEENGNCIAKDMAEPVRLGTRSVPGVKWEKADKRPGSRKQGWEQMRKMLAATARGPGIIREKPGLFVFSTCGHFLEIVPSLPRDQRDLDDLDTTAEDHIADETRYYVRYDPAIRTSGRTVGAF